MQLNAAFHLSLFICTKHLKLLTRGWIAVKYMTVWLFYLLNFVDCCRIGLSLVMLLSNFFFLIRRILVSLIVVVCHDVIGLYCIHVSLEVVYYDLIDRYCIQVSLKVVCQNVIGWYCIYVSLIIIIWFIMIMYLSGPLFYSSKHDWLLSCAPQFGCVICRISFVWVLYILGTDVFECNWSKFLTDDLMCCSSKSHW